jgi:hypothetical protein
MHIQDYLEMVYKSEQQLAKAFSKVAQHHQDEPDIYYMCLMLALWSIEHAKDLHPFREKYAHHASITKVPEQSNHALFNEPRKGELALLSDLQDLWLLTKEIEICWNVLLQAAKAGQDEELETACVSMAKETKRQSDWLIARIKQVAPYILVAVQKE